MNSPLLLYRIQIANINNILYIYDKSISEIIEMVNPYLTRVNINKYLLVRDDSGECQSITYMAYKIVNDNMNGLECPLLSTIRAGPAEIIEIIS
jgi:hypothetical protein